MSKSHSESYKRAGVDVTAGYEAVRLMKRHVESTFTPGVLGGLGGFGGLFVPDLSEIREPVLVSGTDGVGTKLKLAFLMNRHDTVGIDCVAMCVNDIICSGATPLFFLDYIAMGKNIPERVAAVVSGVAEGCRQSGCALIGGESAEMPGFYPEDEYDLAGFSVGVVDRSRIIDGSAIREGDVLVGIASSGVHSNGFSLIRKIFPMEPAVLGEKVSSLGMTLGEALLTPTRIYVSAIKTLCATVAVKGLCHITGGGFYENVPRMFPEGLGAVIEKSAFPVLPIFRLIAERGMVPERDMYNTYNMGIGMVAAVAPDEAGRAITALNAMGEKAYVIGRVVSGDGVEIVE